MPGQPHADRDRASPTPLPLGVDGDSWELFLADVTQLTLDRAAPRPDERELGDVGKEQLPAVVVHAQGQRGRRSPVAIGVWLPGHGNAPS